MGKPGKNIISHLAQQIDDIERHPVFGDEAVFAAIEVHHPHAHRPARSRHAEPAIAGVRGRDARPTAGDNEIAVTDPPDMLAAAPVGKGGQEGDLVDGAKPV